MCTNLTLMTNVINKRRQYKDLCTIKLYQMKKLIVIGFVASLLFIMSCGESPKSDNNTSETNSESPKSMLNEKPEGYDPKRGEGKYTAEMLKLDGTIDDAKAKTGEGIVGVKCASCHKMTDEKLVGPGWKGVTTRRTPEWIMNFISNPDPMIEKDPAVQAQLELCLVRMPNQGLNDDEARNILEYMLKNDK
jgi:competence protein ComGC